MVPFNNPPEQSVSCSPQNWLANQLTDCSGGLLKGDMDIFKNGCPNKWMDGWMDG